MAGTGPPPKPANERRRRNQKPTTELPAEGHTGDVPALPTSYKAPVQVGRDRKIKTLRFLKDTREWYATWARSPMATEFDHVHWLRLRDMAVLHDRWLRFGDLDVAKELRLQTAAFGGTPMDLRRLGREIKRPEEKPASAQPTDPRNNVRRLRAVDPASAAG